MWEAKLRGETHAVFILSSWLQADTIELETFKKILFIYCEVVTSVQISTPINIIFALI